jgi:hypothetical protein
VSAVRQATLRLSPSASLGASAKQGKLSRKAREVAHPQLVRSMLEDEPALCVTTKSVTVVERE